MVSVTLATIPQAALLEACPFCGYSLQGLPTEHTCPECGKTYDRRWRVFGNRPRWQYFSRKTKASNIVGAAFLALGYVWAVFQARFWSPGMLILRLLSSLIMVLVLGRELRRLFGPPGHFIAVGPDTVVVLHRKGSERNLRFLLNDVRNTAEPGLARLIRKRNPREQVLRRLAGIPGEKRRCAAYIDSLLAHVESPA